MLDIAPTDAARLDLPDGARIRVISRYGTTVLTLRHDKAVKAGDLFATFHTAEAFLNQVTSPHRDGYVAAPEYKVTRYGLSGFEKFQEVIVEDSSPSCRMLRPRVVDAYVGGYKKPDGLLNATSLSRGIFIGINEIRHC